MKKILIISDSHGSKSKIEWLKENESFDYLFFLGDGIKDLDDCQLDSKVVAVAGNCDIFSTETKQRVVAIENVRMLLTHGHLYKAKLTTGIMINEAVKIGLNIICFGHTHSKCYETIDGITLLNPGALANGDYAILWLENGKIINYIAKNLY